MFVTPAFAQAVDPAAGGAASLVTSFVPLILIFIIMYFLLFRPQRQAMKRREAMLAAVQRGDTVVTGGGLVGKVTHVDDVAGEVDVDLGQGTKVRAVRTMLADVREGPSKTAAAKDGAKGTKTAKPKITAAPSNDDAPEPKVKSRTRR